MKVKYLARWSTALLLGAASANAQVREPVTTGAALISVPSPDESSGYSRLDEAAIRLVRLVRVRPGTVDGKVVTGCLVLPIEFRLQD